MAEVAFRVKNDSDFYKGYFFAKDQREIFHNFAKKFFDKHGLSNDGRYCQSEVLTIDLSGEQRDKYSNQIKKYADENGMYTFKKASAMQKEWLSDVVEKCDLSISRKYKLWWFPFITRGSYSLWDRNGEIYGVLKDYCKDDIKLPDYFEPIKMSEYYKQLEKED